MFNLMSLYIGKTIFNKIMMILFILVSLSGLIKFIEELSKVGQTHYTGFNAVLFTLLNLPKEIEIFFPIATLLGTLFGLSSMVIQNELVIMQSSGFSNLQVVNSVIKIVIPLMFLTIIIGNYIVPFSMQLAYNYRVQAMHNGSTNYNKKSLWIKNINDFIFIQHFINKNNLSGINIYHFDKTNSLNLLIYIAHANFINGKWKLSQIEEIDLTNNKHIIKRKFLNCEWKTNLTPDRLEIFILEPNYLPILKLYNYISYLKQFGQEYSRYQLNMWNKISSPLSLIIMVFIALSSIFRSSSHNSINMRVIIGIIFGFSFYILDHVINQLVLVYHILPVLGVLLPKTFFLVISAIKLSKCL